MSVDIVRIIEGPTPVVRVVNNPTQIIEVIQQGPQGPGGGASASNEFIQSAPASTWNIPFPTGMARRPDVQLYSTSGEAIEADVVATIATSIVTVTFPSPFAGSAVLT